MKNAFRVSALCAAFSISGLSLAAAPAIEPIMQTLPGGSFSMGFDQPLQTGPTGEMRVLKSVAPVHRVTIKPFRISKYEVTVREFSRFAAAGTYIAPKDCVQMSSKEWFDKAPGNWAGNKHSSSEFEPVTCIGWNGAQAYVQWLAEQTGKKYRLPTEAEWEYAARAGTDTPYYWGEDIGRSQSCQFANTADRAAEAAIKRDYDGLESKNHVGVVPCDDQSSYASVVGMYQPNAFGLHDMIGNINEFTADCYNKDHQGAPTDGSARLDGECAQRVLRGGSWHWPLMTSMARTPGSMDMIGALEGIRIVEELSEAEARQVTQLKPDTRRSPATAAFEKELAEAQQRVRSQRAAVLGR